MGRWQWPTEISLWSWSSYNCIRSCQRTQHDHSMVVWHLKQIGKVKNLHECLMSWSQTKKPVFLKCVFFYSIQKQGTMSQPDFNVWQKVDFIQQPVMTRSVIGPNKKLQTLTSQSQTCTQNRSWSLFGGLMPIWFTIASESWWNHYSSEVCSANWWDALKTAMPAASIGKQNGPDCSPWQCPIAGRTMNASKKLNELGCEVCLICHIHLTFHQLITTSLSILKTFCRENASTTSRRQKILSKSLLKPKHGFLCYRNKTYFLLTNMCWL